MSNDKHSFIDNFEGMSAAEFEKLMKEREMDRKFESILPDDVREQRRKQIVDEAKARVPFGLVVSITPHSDDICGRIEESVKLSQEIADFLASRGYQCMIGNEHAMSDFTKGIFKTLVEKEG